MKLTEAEKTILNKHIDKFVKVKGVNEYGEQFVVEGKLAGICKDAIRIRQVYNDIKDNSIKQKNTFFDIDFYFENKDNNFMLLEVFDNNENKIFKNQNKIKILKETRKTGIEKSITNANIGFDISIYDPVLNKLKDMVGKPIVIESEEVFGKIVNIGLFSALSIQGPNGNVLCHFISKDRNFVHGVRQNTNIKIITPEGEVVLVEDNSKYDLEDIWDERRLRYKKIQKENEMAKELIKLKENQKEVIDDDWWREK